MSNPTKLSCVLGARDAGTKAVIKGLERAHKCQFLQLRCAGAGTRAISLSFPPRSNWCTTTAHARTAGLTWSLCRSSRRRQQMKLCRLAHELLRHFGLPACGAKAEGAAAPHETHGMAAAAEGASSPAGGDASDGWQVLLYPDLSAHGHLKNTSWGPCYPHDVTVRHLTTVQWRRAARPY
jgi:hypothetical protein